MRKGGTCHQQNSRTLARRSNGIFPGSGQGQRQFSQKVLALFDKHFGFRRSIFFPYHYTAFPGGQARRVNTLSNYITYGIRYGPMYDYKDHIYKDDIFRYSSLPPHLKGKRVIFTEDVMTLEDYERTPYGIHMSAEDLYYQAVLFFFLGDRVIGSMGLFHTKRRAAFGKRSGACWSIWRSWWSPTTMNYLRHSGEARFP